MNPTTPKIKMHLAFKKIKVHFKMLADTKFSLG